MNQNPHIRTDTSPEREKHLRVLADQGDNALRDALAMIEARTREWVERVGRVANERDDLRKELAAARAEAARHAAELMFKAAFPSGRVAGASPRETAMWYERVSAEIVERVVRDASE